MFDAKISILYILPPSLFKTYNTIFDEKGRVGYKVLKLFFLCGLKK